MKKLLLVVMTLLLLAWGASWIDYALERSAILVDVETPGRELRACLAGDATRAELEDRWRALSVERLDREPDWGDWPDRCEAPRRRLHHQLGKLAERRPGELTRAHVELKDALFALAGELSGLPPLDEVARVVSLLDELLPSAAATPSAGPPLAPPIAHLAPLLPGGRVAGIEHAGRGLHLIDGAGSRVCAVDATTASCWLLPDAVPRGDGIHVAWSPVFPRPAVAATWDDGEGRRLGVFDVRAGTRRVEVALAPGDRPRGAAVLDDGTAAVLVDGDPAWVARARPGEEPTRHDLPAHGQLSMLGPWIALSDPRDGDWGLLPWTDPIGAPRVFDGARDVHGCTTAGPAGLRTFLQLGPSTLAVHEPAAGWTTLTHDFEGAHEVTCTAGEAFVSHLAADALWFHRCDREGCVGPQSGDHGQPGDALPHLRGAAFGERAVVVHEASPQRVTYTTGPAATRWGDPWATLHWTDEPLDGHPGVIFAEGFALVLLPLPGGTAAYRVFPSGDAAPVTLSAPPPLTAPPPR